MTQRSAWVVGLWVALLSGLLVAWSPQYWPVTVAVTGISMVTIWWVIGSGLLLGGRVEWARQTWLVGLIGAWGFLQLAMHTTLLPQMTLDISFLWALAACAFVLGTQILKERADCRFFLELMLWSLTALAVIAMLQFYSTPVRVFGIFPADESVVGTLLSRNQFAALMELAAPMALWYMLERNAVMGGLCYAMILAATITAASRAGAVLVIGELAIFVIQAVLTRRRERKTILAICGGLTLLVVVAGSIAGLDRIKTRFEDPDPYAIRRQLSDSTRQLIAERPWSGYGMGTWRAVYPRAATFDTSLVTNEAHNDWAQWAFDGGIPFLILMGALVLWVAKPAVQSMWGLGVLSVMVHSYVDYPIREPALSFLWFAMAGAVSQFKIRSVGSKRRIHADQQIAPVAPGQMEEQRSGTHIHLKTGRIRESGNPLI